MRGQRDLQPVPGEAGRDGGDCVEVGWHKSSYSVGNGDCVEIAPTPAGVLVRDSKYPDGETLAFGTPHWRAFLTTIASRV